MSTDQECDELAAHMRVAVFAGRKVSLSHTQIARQQFGLTLLSVLCTGLRIDERCGLHAMLLWTMSISASHRGGDMDVCVACLMVCAKMHETSANFGLSTFAGACRRVFESRDATTRALEVALQSDIGRETGAVHFLASTLKMFDAAELVNEVQVVSAQDVRYAELFLLFTDMHSMWYRYLIELYDYVMSKTHGLSSDSRMRVVLEICRVPTQ
jgi:hypothetical protein